MKVLWRSKWLPVVISIVFAMVLFAGCGNNNNDSGGGLGNISVGGDGRAPASGSEAQYKTADMNDGWPSAELPPGFPKYSGGDQYYEVDEYGVFIYVLETDKKTFNDYMDLLTSFGFDFDAGPDADGWNNAMMGSWSLAVFFDEEWSVTGILVSDWGSDFVSAEWPAILPEYPDGKIFVSEFETSNSIWISVENTSQASLEKYYDMLINAGWERSIISDSLSWETFEKDKWNVDISIHDGGTSLSISLMELTVFNDLPAEWPAAHLPSGFPVYPEGDVEYASLGDDGTVFVSIKGTSQNTMDAYKVTLENAGWRFDEKTGTGYWYGYKDDKVVSLSVSSGGTESIMVG